MPKLKVDDMSEYNGTEANDHSPNSINIGVGAMQRHSSINVFGSGGSFAKS